MKTNDIINGLTNNLSAMPATVCASMVAFTYGTTKATAAKALDLMVAAGVLKKNGLLYSK